jgi:hypothetical protein
MVGVELGAQLANALGVSAAPPAPASSPGFDFRAFMRETRATVEQLLGDGQVAAAESYMSARRDEVNRHGYRIRKLNQAYFALYGSYGDAAAASPTNPIPSLLRTLRTRSGTLGQFIFDVRQLTTVDELRRAAS